MGNIVGKQFGVVASINYEAALKESVKEGNQAKFYLASQRDAGLDSIDPSDEFNTKRRNALIINGNKIQGISEEDSVKLDELSHVTKIFQYKGSVATGDDLKAKVPPEASVGDVWNVEQECEIDGVKYPAHTNFVCSSAKASIDGKPASSTWDSLGGTIQMGTIAKVTADQNHTLIFAGNNDIPINSFQINVARERGLVFDENNILSLQYIDPIPTKRDKTVTYYAGDIHGNLKPMRYISLSEGTGIALSTKNDNSIEISAESTFADRMTVISEDTPKTVISISSSKKLLNEVMISIGSGLKMETSDDALKGITLRIAETDHVSSSTNKIRGSGLAINNMGELYIAISTSAIQSENYIPALQLLNFDEAQQNSGGLAINGPALLKWLSQNNGFNYYINSLIDKKLEAQ